MHALGHQPGAERHHQRLHAQQRDADAVDQADDQPDARARSRRDHASPSRRVMRRHQDRPSRWRRWRPKGRCRRSASPASAPPRDAERRREQQHVREPRAALTVPGCATSTPATKAEQQQHQQRRWCCVAASAQRAGKDRKARPWRSFARSRATSTKPPIITITTISVPWITWPKFGIDVEEDQVGRDQRQHEGGDAPARRCRRGRRPG